MSKKKDIIRVGDKVKILRPLFIYRWGYDNNLSDVYDEVMKKYQPQIWEFLNNIHGMEGQKTGLMSLSNFPQRYITRIAESLAYYIVGTRMRGGSVRKLFYREPNNNSFPLFSNYVDPHGQLVSQIKIAKTGTYFAPWSGEGGYDWEPGGLYEEKTHKLLRLEGCQDWIEAINVEKVHDGT